MSKLACLSANARYVSIKKDKGTDYFFSWKSKGVCSCKLRPFYTAFLHSIKLSGCRLGKKFNKNSLAVEENNYLTKIVNIYIIYDLDAWARDPSNYVKFKNWLLASASVVNDSDQDKYVYSGYGITFDSADLRSFDNDSARNVIIFDDDNSWLYHADNCKNNFVLLSEIPTFGINESFRS